MNIQNALNSLGLTKNESNVYIHLAKKTPYSGAEVWREMNLDKSSFYRALKSLENMGLVRISGESRNQKFYPASTNKLISIQKKKIKELETAGKSLENFSDEIQKLASKDFLKNNIQIFEGENAYFEFMEQKLKSDVKVIRDLTADKEILYKFAGSQKKYDEYISGFIKKRVAKKIKIKMLLDKTAVPNSLQLSNSSDLKEARRFAGKLNSNCFLNVFGDKVGFMTIKAGKFWGVLIEDKFISSLVASLFDGIWEMSEEV